MLRFSGSQSGGEMRAARTRQDTASRAAAEPAQHRGAGAAAALDRSARGERLGALARLSREGSAAVAQRLALQGMFLRTPPERPAVRAGGVVQAMIVKDGKPLSPEEAGRLAKHEGWPGQVVQDVVKLAQDTTRSMTWKDVVRDVNAAFFAANVRSRFGQDGDSDDESDYSHASEADSSVAESEASDASGPELERLARREILAPRGLQEAALAVGYEQLGTAGRKTNSAFATGSAGGVEMFGRDTHGKDSTWASGRAGGPDRLQEDAQPRHDHFHAEEKTILSQAWKAEVDQVLNLTARDGQERSIHVLINRSSCPECEQVLIDAAKAIQARMVELRIPERLIRMSVAVRGAYGKGDPESTKRLQTAGWSVVTMPGPDGRFSERGYQQIATSSGLVPKK